MTPTLRPHPAYKRPGILWQCGVPSHWDLVQLGRIGRVSKGTGGTKEDETSDGIPCIRYGDIYTSYRFHIMGSRTFVAEEKAREYTPIQYGDILFAGSGETIEGIGKSAVNLMDSPACCGGDVILFRPHIEIDARFSGYAIDCPQSQYQKSCMGRGITIMHIYGNELKRLCVALPPLPEQRAIVRYLDYVNRRIRRYVGAKRKLVALLKEERQAVIDRAVSRGLDPDVRLKPSGVLWLGDVPEHWEVAPSRAVFTEINERDHPDEQMLSVTIDRGVIRQHNLLQDSAQKDSSRLDKSAYKLVSAGDLAYNKMRAWQGAIGVSRYRGIVSPAYIVQRPRNGADPSYFHHLLRTPAFAAEAERWSYGIASDMWSLRPEHFKMVYVPFPPLPEQSAIVEYLTKATTNMDAAIARARRQIELALEYRTRVIADLMAGKLDVREAAAQLPKEAGESEPIDESSPFADDMDDNPHDADEAVKEPAVESEVTV